VSPWLAPIPITPTASQPRLIRARDRPISFKLSNYLKSQFPLLPFVPSEISCCSGSQLRLFLPNLKTISRERQTRFLEPPSNLNSNTYHALSTHDEAPRLLLPRAQFSCLGSIFDLSVNLDVDDHVHDWISSNDLLDRQLPPLLNHRPPDRSFRPGMSPQLPDPHWPC
jgi:hypothetical protein